MEALKNFTEHWQILFLSNDLNNWVQGGYSGFHLTGMIVGFFWVWNFRFRYFFVRKILIYVEIFLRIQNNLKLSFCIILLMKQKMFLGVSSVDGEKAFIDIRHEIFSGGGVNFCAGIFCVLLETQRIFFQGGKVDFCPHSSISVTWNPEAPLPLRPGCHRRSHWEVVTFKITQLVSAHVRQ